jgi:two-component system, NarL family, sensor histidine kinase UhpB
MRSEGVLTHQLARRRTIRPGDASLPLNEPPRRYLPLVYRVAGLNVLLVVAAVALTVIVLAPGYVTSYVVDEEIAVLAAAIVVVVAANIYLVRRLVGPVQALTALARRVDLSRPGQRIEPVEPTSEAGELGMTFNEMLARLEAERREATGRVLAAQEAERLRIAQELHDQVGQELTAVLLGLSRIHSHAPDMLQQELLTAQDEVRASLAEVRRIAVELRPEALDDLGLESALALLAERSRERLGLEVTLSITSELPPLDREAELVVYRVAQEALTNVARHAGVKRAEVMLAWRPGRLELAVRDYGQGLPAGSTPGTGIRGMQERAALIDARIKIRDLAPEAGCEVRLEVPFEREP